MEGVRLIALLFTLGIWRSSCEEGSQLTVPRGLILEANFSSQMLHLVWEQDLSSDVFLFDIEVMRYDQLVYNETSESRPDVTTKMNNWRWTSSIPLECTSHYVRIRSRSLRGLSNWSEWQNITGKDTPQNPKGQVYPQDKVVMVGSKLEFCCIVRSGKRFGKIQIGREIQNATRLSERSYTFLRTNRDPSEVSGTNVICLHDDLTLAWGSVVFVGYPPDDRDLVCETRDLQSVQCHWSKGRSTRLYHRQRTVHTLNGRECNDVSFVKDAICKLNMSFESGIKNWTLKAENPLGRVELTDTADISLRVYPLAPIVSTHKVNARDTTLHWHWASPWYETLPLLCQVQLTWDRQNLVRTYEGTGLTQAFLQDLHPSEQYTITVRCGTLHNFWKWGTWSSELTLKTKEDRPEPVDMWVRMSSNASGCVFWKPLTKRQSNGPIQSYNVTITSFASIVHMDMVLGRNYSCFSFFDNSSSYTVMVTAKNTAGTSPVATIVPRFHPDFEDNISQIVGKENGFDLSWTPNPSVTCGYVVECQPAGGKPNGSSLFWLKLPSDNSSARIQSGIFEPGVKYNLSIYTCVNGTPELLTRMQGYTEEQVPVSPVTALNADQQGSNVQLQWGEVPLEAQRGFIRGYGVYVYRDLNSELLGNITDHLVRNYTVKGLSMDTYKFTVRAYTSAGLGEGSTVTIKLDQYIDMLILEIFVSLSIMTVLLALVTMLCYKKREWVKRTFYPVIPKPKLPEWSSQKFVTATLDVKPCPHSTIHVVENSGRLIGKEELTVVPEVSDEDIPADTDSSRQGSLRYYNQVVGEDLGPDARDVDSSASTMGSSCTEVTYTGIQASCSSDTSSSSSGIPAQQEHIFSGDYRPQMDPVPDHSQPSDPSDPILLKAYQPQSQRLDSPEESDLGSPTSVCSSQFLLPESPKKDDDGHTSSSTKWFRSLLSNKY